jgi:hypothetical protein
MHAQRTHIFAVAIEHYQDASIPSVVYGENDAREFVEAWQALGAHPSDCVVLLSDRATVTAIRSRFKTFLKGVQPGDRVVVFYAGHGAAFNDLSHLTAHDTQWGDLQATSIPLSELLKDLRGCKSEQALLFLDVCHSGWPVTPGVPSICSPFSTGELMPFVAESEAHLAFVSCKGDECSFPGNALKHGLWSHGVIQALRGEADKAMVQGSLITGSSLQCFVAEEVPRLLRLTITGPESQTPCVFGNLAKDATVADLGELLAAKAVPSNQLGSAIEDTTLRGAEVGPVRKLQGFRKGSHREPDRHSPTAEGFIRSIGAEDVKRQADDLYKRIKAGFGYKSLDMLYSCDDGAATIKTPDFDVNIVISQDSGDPGGYVVTTDVGVFRRRDVVGEEEFSRVFSSYCDTVVVALARSIDVGQRIDAIEERPELATHLESAPDRSWLTLELPTPRIIMRVTAAEITFKLPGRGNLKDLLANAQATFAALSGSGIALLLPSAASSMR